MMDNQLVISLKGGTMFHRNNPWIAIIVLMATVLVSACETTPGNQQDTSLLAFEQELSQIGNLLENELTKQGFSQ
jgi:predicted small secreted protein